MSEEEYLRTSYNGVDPEFRDGELLERSLPKYSHSRTQVRICHVFESHPGLNRLKPATELRLRLRPGRIAVADIAVFESEPQDEVPATPPLIAIEILSDTDRMSDVTDKLAEYRAWGVPHVWLADPRKRRLYVLDDTFHEVAQWQIAEPPLTLTKDDVFDPPATSHS